tara:strand:- start:5749 stop:6585 length:837 start_codon:yes stop_codon:yes gene_type:complete
MQFFRITLFILFLVLTSCSKEKNIEVIEEKEINLQMIDAYQEGMKFLDDGDGLTAAKKFSEAELLFPQSLWAPRAALMAAYAYYKDEYYSDTIYEVERFLKTYPNHQRTDYAYYLLAVTHYNLIVDETRDLQSMLEAKNYFEIIIQKYPNTEYAIDSKFKLELINEILAAKEMYLAKYYFSKKKWIPAINRFKIVLENYDESIFVEEALHRLVEIHYIIGLEKEAKNYAFLLGYNYQSSEWYKKSFKVFNKNYKGTVKNLKKNKKKKTLIDKIKTKIF